MTILPLRVSVAKRIDISYAATRDGFGWEWQIDVDDRHASGRAFLALDGSLDLAWLGNPYRWPDGETGVIQNSDTPSILSLEETFGNGRTPSSFVIPVGTSSERISGGRIALRRTPHDWDIEMWLPPPPDELARLVPLTNPSYGETKIRLDLPVSGVVSLEVYDVAGRRVRTLLSDRKLASGPHRIVWDGIDEAGRNTPAGIYWIRLKAGGKRQSLSIVRMGS